ncbi:unnamed protein product [Paramecium pentaurelia]|uniref:Uncharacterized protein n=1 Tax=Paramecium pentaurelia TaxID=43138 RepID=A0A8S1TT40_9CILI|nr:unnamed protein product [Paramecium pentaurelia]
MFFKYQQSYMSVKEYSFGLITTNLKSIFVERENENNRSYE